MSTEFLIIGGALVVIIGIAVAAIIVHMRIERARTEKMRAWTEGMGLSFIEEIPDFDASHGQFQLFGAGHSRKTRNVAQGDVEIGGMRASFLCGDHKRTEGSGKHQHTIKSTFVLLQPAFRMGANLIIRPENWFDKVKKFFGYGDIDVAHAEFSRRFHVQCSDREFVAAMIDDGLARHFLERPFGIAVIPNIEWRPEGLLVWTDKRWEPVLLDATLGWIDGFLSRIPEPIRAALAENDDAHDADASAADEEARG